MVYVDEQIKTRDDWSFNQSANECFNASEEAFNRENNQEINQGMYFRRI